MTEIVNIASSKKNVVDESFQNIQNEQNHRDVT